MRWSIVLVFFSIAACFGDGGSTAPPPPANSPPVISNLDVSPSAVEVTPPGQQITLSGTADFTDRDGNLDTVTLTVTDSEGNVIVSQTTTVPSVSGVTAGTLQGQIIVDASVVGDYALDVYVTDARGARSNTLNGLFRILEPAWLSRTPMPIPRPGFATAVLDGEIYVLGGLDPTLPPTPEPATTTVQIYDPATDTWTMGPGMSVAQYNHRAATANGKIYVFAGEPDFGVRGGFVQVFDPATQDWSDAGAADMPDSRNRVAGTSHEGRVYSAGGSEGDMPISSLLVYDPVLNTWGAGAPMSESRFSAGAVSLGDRIFVYGGYTSTHVSDAGFRRLLESYDPVMDTWMTLADGLPRADFGMAVHDGLIYAFGGNNLASSLDWVEAYDSATDSWLGKQSMPIELGFVRAETNGNSIYVFGVENTFKYTPANDLD